MVKRITRCIGTAAAMALVPTAASAGTKAKQSVPHISTSDFKEAVFNSYDEPPGRAEHGNGNGYGTDAPDEGSHKGWDNGNHFGWGNGRNGSGGS
ncbi:hypothetical protein [Novosphingobium malaysiense]|uniref:Lipoprotein n=1 Tax=Novosphingobium malaysiense TaxID=1348853 RepID=A0A0B1ZQ28_9SPHN|nr:hypothetical protein [Novosphingobium malaysiense]KHK91312.1 hypothetical protein LK12_10565 [Novosphingobium malaysiense]